MSAAETITDGLVEAPNWTVGDRLAAFVALLPAAPVGPVLLLVSDDLAPHLQAALPGAIVLGGGRSDGWPEPSRVLRWDGERPPVAEGRAGLVVVDATAYDEQAAARLVAPDGVLAVLGRHGPHLVYPDLLRPEVVWRRGWPVQMTAGPVPWLRRRLGLSVGRGATVPRLRVTPPTRSLADAVIDDLAAATGLHGTLVGLFAGGHAVLRVHTDRGDVAVRLSLVDHAREVDISARIADEVPEAAAYLPERVAEGRTAGRPWVATWWSPRHRRATWPWSPEEQRWRAASDLAEVLAARRTGATAPGWAERWVAGAALLPPETAARWAATMRVLDEGLPTAWCHGDLWPGNVLLDGDDVTVIDWDNASAEAPSGLDLVLLAAMRRGGDLLTADLLRVGSDPEALGDAEVAGRPWREHDAEHRTALALAAVVVHLRNRSLHDLGTERLHQHLDAVDAPPPAPLAVVEPAPAADDRVADERVGDAHRTARGALWLATNGIVVKTSQTVVLLTLAAMLAPESLGLVALGTLVANISAVVSSLGTASALVYWRGDVHRAARTAVTIGVATGGVLAVLLWLAAPTLAAALNAEDGGAAVIRGLTVTLPCLAVAAVTNELLRRRLEFVRRIIPDTVSSVIGAVVAVVLAAEGHGVMALVVGQVVQAGLTMLLAWVVHPPVLPGWNRDDARGLLDYGAPYAGANLLELVQLNVDYLIVSWVLGSAALGQYSLAFRLAFMPYLMIVVVTTGAAFPYLCRQRGAELGRATVTMMTATLSLVAPICLGLVLFADHLVVLGDKWEPGVPVVAWLALYALLLSVGQSVQTALNAAGRPGLSLVLRSCHLVLLLVALLLVADHGITAVAVAQVVVASVVALGALVLARLYVVGLSLGRLVASLRPAALAAAVMAAVVLVLRTLLDLDAASLTGLVGVGLAGVAAYVVTIWAADRTQLRDAARLLRRTS